MAILTVKCKNYKIHEELDINFDGKSAILLGDSGQGKSTIIDIIESCFLRKQFDTNPLTKGKESGFIELETEIDGKKYTVSRTFSKDKRSSDRFEVRASDGSRHTLTNMLNNVLGASFTNKYFDYQKYFFELKSSTARVDYLTKSIGDNKIQENTLKVKNLKKERQVIGSQRIAQSVLVTELSTLDKDTIQSKVVYYKDARKIEEAKAAKEGYVNTKSIRIDRLTNEREVVSERVEKLNLVNQQIEEKKARIEELELELQLLKGDLVILRKQKEDIPAKCVKQLAELDAKIQKAEVTNREVIAAADQIYEAEIEKIQQFNIERAEFINGIKALKEYSRLDAEYKEMTATIEKVEAESKELFKASIPIPEITYEVDEEGNDMIMYKGREFTFDNISKGESIRVASAIQRAMNPKGANFILIQEAQSLGSGVDEILAEAKKFQLQVIMEITQRDEPLQVVFIDENPETILTKKKPAARKKSPTVKKPNSKTKG